MSEEPITVENINIAKAVYKFGSIHNATLAAEKLAAELMAEDAGEDSFSFVTQFIDKISMQAHLGNCPKARSWMIGPISCEACLYDKYMLKAWQRLQAE